MNTDTPESILPFTSLFAGDDAYWVPFIVARKLERERDELNHQLARSQAAGTIWYRRCFGEDAEWQLGELTKLRSALIRINDAVVARAFRRDPRRIRDLLDGVYGGKRENANIEAPNA